MDAGIAHQNCVETVEAKVPVQEPFSASVASPDDPNTVAMQRSLSEQLSLMKQRSPRMNVMPILCLSETFLTRSLKAAFELFSRHSVKSCRSI